MEAPTDIERESWSNTKLAKIHSGNGKGRAGSIFTFKLPLQVLRGHPEVLWTHSECPVTFHNAWSNPALHKNEPVALYHIENYNLQHAQTTHQTF